MAANITFLTIACMVLAATAQGPISIGKFRSFAHGVKSGRVQLVDDKTIKIQDFFYEGDAPDTWFVVGRDNKYTQEKPRGGLPFTHIVADENGRCERPKKYSGKTIELTLPGNVTTADISYLAVYCITFNHNFGYVRIPKGTRAPFSMLVGPTKRCPRPESAKKIKSTAPSASEGGYGNKPSDNRRTVRRIIKLLRMLE